MVCFPISWELTITSQSSSLFNIFQKVFLPWAFIMEHIPNLTTPSWEKRLRQIY